MLKDKIQQDLKESLKQRDVLEASVIRMLNAAIKNKEIEKRTKLSKKQKSVSGTEIKDREEFMLDDLEIIDTVVSEIKKRKESIHAYEKGGRSDLADKEKAEIKILEKYMPPKLSEEELREIVKDVIKECGASGLKDFGRVMSSVMVRARGRAEGNIVSEMVKETLGS